MSRLVYTANLDSLLMAALKDMALTARELAAAAFPELPLRLSQRRSSSRTQPVTPRTFSDLVAWPNFLVEARQCSFVLDDQRKVHLNPMECFGPLDVCSDEVGVRGALENLLFPTISKVVVELGYPLKYRSGGSGRSYSFTDMVLMDMSIPQTMGDKRTLSKRIFGNGEAKGPWQWLLPTSQQLDEAITNSPKPHIFIEPIQQLYGDMILDESRYGFISNYNQTIFFRRARVVIDKTLEFSPVILVGEAPVQTFLYVLSQAYNDGGAKSLLPRECVPNTPNLGYNLRLPPIARVSSFGRAIKKASPKVITVKAKRGGGGRAAVLEVDLSSFSVPVVENFVDLPQYDLIDIGASDQVLGMGKFGNVVEGRFSNGIPLALKFFDLRVLDACRAFLQEQVVNKKLEILQRHCTPVLYAVGRVPHCNVVYLALSDEGNHELGSSSITRMVRTKILGALEQIHNLGIVLNDIKLSHVLLHDGSPKFIDFEESFVAADEELFKSEVQSMEELLEVLT